MNCKDWEERIALFAGGDLSPALEAEVKRHLAECAGCRAFAEGIEDSLTLLRSAHEEPIAAGHYTAVRAAVLARLARERRPWRRWMWAPALALGLAVAGVFVAVRPAKMPKITVAALRYPELPAVAVWTPEPVAPGERNRPRGAGASGTAPPVAASSRVPAAAQGHGPETSAPVEPLVVKLITNDPDVVIYWIADRKGEAQ
jgi:anti-sigma factor RsiW